MSGPALTLIDNYDSFVHTLADYCRTLGVETRVVRNDAATLEELSACDALLLSPGPGGPSESGVCVEAVRRLERVPTLGVCLGHQAIAFALGGRVSRVEPRHGRASVVTHTGGRLLAGVPSPFEVGRYHSLAVDRDRLPTGLRVTAEAEDGTVMAVEHDERPLFGVQFHPESVLSECGRLILANFLSAAGFAVGRDGELAAIRRPAGEAAGDDFYGRPAAGPVRPM